MGTALESSDPFENSGADHRGAVPVSIVQRRHEQHMIIPGSAKLALDL